MGSRALLHRTPQARVLALFKAPIPLGTMAPPPSSTGVEAKHVAVGALQVMALGRQPAVISRPKAMRSMQSSAAST